MISDDALFGVSQAHLVHDSSGKHLIHKAVFQPLKHLQSYCTQEGVSCDIVSGYRSFERQLSIWERKWQGLLPLRSIHGDLLDHEKLSDEEKLDTILTWSALPGASRHHWGTDIDIYDHVAAEKMRTPFQLVPEEYEAGGPFEKLNDILSHQLSNYHFHRPYRVYEGGIAQEPWHISYTPLADEFAAQFSAERYHAFLCKLNFLGKRVVLDNFDRIYEQFILNKGHQLGGGNE
jgi:LAS superfamily LD-carboxypeptidase LdcB